MNVDDRRPSRRSAKPLPPAGEELLALAGRAGLDPISSDHLRRLMSDWSERFHRRLSTQHRAVPDAALVALTVSYLRRLRRRDQRRASRG